LGSSDGSQLAGIKEEKRKMSSAVCRRYKRTNGRMEGRGRAGRSDGEDVEGEDSKTSSEEKCIEG